jgi:hypothetical protein
MNGSIYLSDSVLPPRPPEKKCSKKKNQSVSDAALLCSALQKVVSKFARAALSQTCHDKKNKLNGQPKQKDYQIFGQKTPKHRPIHPFTPSFAKPDTGGNKKWPDRQNTGQK